MKIGKFEKDEKKIKLNIEIFCSNCKKKVPGGIQTGENYSQTNEFRKELVEFKKQYLCGICRDKKRIKINSKSRSEK